MKGYYVHFHITYHSLTIRIPHYHHHASPMYTFTPQSKQPGHINAQKCRCSLSHTTSSVQCNAAVQSCYRQSRHVRPLPTRQSVARENFIACRRAPFRMKNHNNNNKMPAISSKLPPKNAQTSMLARSFAYRVVSWKREVEELRNAEIACP